MAASFKMFLKRNVAEQSLQNQACTVRPLNSLASSYVTILNILSIISELEFGCRTYIVSDSDQNSRNNFDSEFRFLELSEVLQSLDEKRSLI